MEHSLIKAEFASLEPCMVHRGTFTPPRKQCCGAQAAHILQVKKIEDNPLVDIAPNEAMWAGIAASLDFSSHQQQALMRHRRDFYTGLGLVLRDQGMGMEKQSMVCLLDADCTSVLLSALCLVTQPHGRDGVCEMLAWEGGGVGCCDCISLRSRSALSLSKCQAVWCSLQFRCFASGQACQKPAPLLICCHFI